MRSKQGTGFYRPRRAKVQGVTLVETMVVVSILGILAALAVPSFQSSIESTRRTAYANQLFEDLAFARSEAIKRGVRVVVCPSGTGTQCTADVDWKVGWMVFVDLSNNAWRDPATEPVLRVHEALNLPSDWVAKSNNSNVKYASYRPLGTVQTFFRICMLPSSADLLNCNDTNITSLSKYTNVVIDIVGRVRIESKN